MFWSETIRDAGEGGHHPSALFSGGKGALFFHFREIFEMF
jgi:hypothetical protein